jgi:hypothetical protein
MVIRQYSKRVAALSALAGRRKRFRHEINGDLLGEDFQGN